MALAEVGKKIRDRRLHLRLTQADIRSRGGPTKDKVLLIEKGEVERLADRTKMGLSLALDWPPSAVDWLIEGDDPVMWERYEIRPGVIQWDRKRFDLDPNDRTVVVVTSEDPDDDPPPGGASARVDELEMAALSGKIAELAPEDRAMIEALADRLLAERRQR